MRAIVCTEWGGPERLALADLPAPALPADGVRVAVQAIGVNFADLLMIAGRYQENPPLPFSPGFEIAGTVAEVAPGVTRHRPGDRVVGMLPHGAYAEQAVLPAADAMPIADTMDFVAAAAFPIAYGTAFGALAWRARLRPTETLLVFGAGGGVGLAAVEIGRALGARVIAVAGSADKRAAAAAHGAADTVDAATDVAAAVLALTGGRGADVVLDPVGGDAFDAALRCIAWEGRLVVIGFAGGRVGQLSAGVALGKNIDLIGHYWGSYRSRDTDRVQRAYRQLARWFEDGRITPHVSAVLPLQDAARALGLLQRRAAVGKIVLTTGGPAQA